MVQRGIGKSDRKDFGGLGALILYLKSVITDTVCVPVPVWRPSILFAISIQRNQLILRKHLQEMMDISSCSYLICSNFSHLLFCIYLSLTFLNANQLNFSLLGTSYHAFCLFTKPLPDTLTVRIRRKPLTVEKTVVRDGNQSLHCTYRLVCSLSADRPYSCWIELGSLSETMTLTCHLTRESSAWFTNG